MCEEDVEELREQLISYYGSAIFTVDACGPISKIDEIENMSDEQIIIEAKSIGIK